MDGVHDCEFGVINESMIRHYVEFGEEMVSVRAIWDRDRDSKRSKGRKRLRRIIMVAITRDRKRIRNQVILTRNNNFH